MLLVSSAQVSSARSHDEILVSTTGILSITSKYVMQQPAEPGAHLNIQKRICEVLAQAIIECIHD